MKLALAVQTPDVQMTVAIALLSGTWEEKLDKAAALGAQGIEVVTVDPKTLDAAAIRAALLERHLEAAAISTGAIPPAAGLTLLHADAARAAEAQARLRELVDFAVALGAPIVTMGNFRGRVASVGAGGREQLLAALRAGAEYAAPRGVRLTLEPLNRYDGDVIRTTEEALAFLADLGSDGVGLQLDTFHVNIEERSWTEPFARALAAGRLWYVQLGDNNRWSPGQGLIDFPAIVRTLRQGGYDGYLSAEHWRVPDPDSAARLTLEYMRPLVS
jgi:5-keto-L-gluconate epimerase